MTLSGVNGDSFTEMGHHDAVKYLSALRGTIRFDLENNIEADIDEVCDMDTRLYQFHISESAEENPKQKENPKVLTYPGKAKDVRSTSTVSLQSQSKANSIESPPKSAADSKPKVTDLPKVHAFASPAKAKSIPKTVEL